MNDNDSRMTKHEMLAAQGPELKSWWQKALDELKAVRALGAKMVDYVSRQFDEESLSALAPFLKRRTSVILYLSEASDFTETQNYSEEEVREVLALLTPSDFDSERDCLYCLKTFETKAELLRHFENCSI